jgi:hypothetical protein
MPLFIPRSSLDPVRVDTLEAAVVLRRKTLSLSASLYASFLRDTIYPVGLFDPERSRALQNTPGANLRGFELDLRRSFGVANAVFANWAWQTGEVDSSAPRPTFPATSVRWARRSGRGPRQRDACVLVPDEPQPEIGDRAASCRATGCSGPRCAPRTWCAAVAGPSRPRTSSTRTISTPPAPRRAGRLPAPGRSVLLQAAYKLQDRMGPGPCVASPPLRSAPLVLRGLARGRGAMRCDDPGPLILKILTDRHFESKAGRGWPSARPCPRGSARWSANQSARRSSASGTRREAPAHPLPAGVHGPGEAERSIADRGISVLYVAPGNAATSGVTRSASPVA